MKNKINKKKERKRVKQRNLCWATYQIADFLTPLLVLTALWDSRDNWANSIAEPLRIP
jgi:hypothetical protein